MVRWLALFFLLTLPAFGQAVIGTSCLPSGASSTTANGSAVLCTQNSNGSLVWTQSPGGVGGPTLNGAIVVDGAKYPTIQSAISALPAVPIGGTVQLPCGVTTISTTVTFDRPVHLVGCGYNPLGIGGSGPGGGTIIRWTGGASPVFVISGGNVVGSTLENFEIDNTGTGTVAVDIDNNAYYVTLRYIGITEGTSPSVGFSTAGVRVGNTGLVPLASFDHCFVSYNATNFLILNATDTTFYGGGIYGGSANDVQLGTASTTAFVTSFFGTEIESTPFRPNVASVLVLNAQVALFSGIYNEENGASGLFMSIPNTATHADNITVEGGRFMGNNTAVNAFSVNLSTATLAVENSFFASFNAGTIVQNTSARHIWTNNLISDSTISGVTSSTANYDAGVSVLNGVRTTVQSPPRFKLTDQGTCTMASGTCTAQSLAATYTAAPLCFANWTGTGTLTGLIKVPSTTTTVTPASSVGTDTAQVNWACLGN